MVGLLSVGRAAILKNGEITKDGHLVVSLNAAENTHGRVQTALVISAYLFAGILSPLLPSPGGTSMRGTANTPGQEGGRFPN